jgi:hypothetical protein
MQVTKQRLRQLVHVGVKRGLLLWREERTSRVSENKVLTKILEPMSDEVNSLKYTGRKLHITYCNLALVMWLGCREIYSLFWQKNVFGNVQLIVRESGWRILERVVNTGGGWNRLRIPADPSGAVEFPISLPGS